MCEHAQTCFRNEPNCLCLTCTKDSAVCCIERTPKHSCKSTVCIDYTPEKTKKTKPYKPISFENILKGGVKRG